MLKKVFNTGTPVRVSSFLENRFIRGAQGFIRSGFEYDGRVDVEFSDEFKLPGILGGNRRLVLVEELEVL